MEESLKKLRSNVWANYCIVCTRLLLGFAFIPSGLVKLYGQPFTTLPTSTPVGYFFDAMHKTGIYWHFIGAMQLLTALLLMAQRLTAVAAVMVLGIVINIFLITVGVGFTGTPIITGLMLLASVLLVCWDYQRISMLWKTEPSTAQITILPDIISNRWRHFGLALFFFLVIVCNLPALVGTARIPVWLLFFLPLVLVIIAFVSVMVIDYKKLQKAPGTIAG